ncbi:DNA mismatch repair protein [Mucilaginibacter sp. SG564]|uniref:MutS-related protein n=1 Tax=Mucilaginibacter sp. SG564 TaxID=2587022 RepID=UPI0015569BFE|nr:DNA mismatch repair protein [Mucilaginibacter sp. SG564]NOW94995.1 DNA mismatch repair ATPase MutS [Mucilaginibacter sp. SG564]
MLFTTDQQTTEDLNIFGKHGGDSIFTMFNHTSTRGGAAIMESMFHSPLSNHSLINKRSRIIQYFSATDSFPFDAVLFDIADQYLANTDERTKLSFEAGSFVKRLSNLVAEDPAYKFVYTGVTAMIEILSSLRSFTEKLALTQEASVKEDLDVITAYLRSSPFDSLPTGNRNGKLAYTELQEVDVLFRFRHRDIIKKLLQYIYHIDVYISVGKTAAHRGFTFPKALQKELHLLNLQGVYHPRLAAPVPNDFNLTPSGNVIFLTGANMAGKSTFMKSVGIAVYLAHMGFPVPADMMEFSVLDGIYTTINLPDNLGSGTSHFYAEVLRVKKVAKELALGKNLFVMFDELFRGTNVKDAYEATIAITTGFAEKKHSMFVISTHIIEAGETLSKRCENIRFSYLPTKMNGLSPEYTYTLKSGITADRHGMLIINNEGIIELLKKGKTQAK